ncbi:UV DNA damage repair endonuclease UvsE [Falsirhodobacter algicola]|uniref:UV DNA damage repair endonuclease UvsE n=1 Tax=Falsirhodobacter algicola TaxID=2692330 RepID=A0A8J8SM48_9RHOB|nr:UV DNA damage repair endonuclease UvsE [Falsirhodobacter algicola]QUS37213.1 UV DNA damage repair endonuclease UvsE [Falsirhodobacter algicola]
MTRPASPSRPLRLGFPVKVMARPDLKSHDARRWQQGPHLKTSLEYLDGVLGHLAEAGIGMYRMSSDLAPYATHPDMPQFHSMIADSDAELAAFGAKARAQGVRLSFHPSQYILLNSPDPELTERSIRDFAAQAEMLDRMGLGPEAVMVTHVGGVYGDHEGSRARWLEGYERCPEPVRRRLVLEHDDIRFSAADVLWIHERCGVPLIFDHQHFCCLNPEGLALRPVLERILASWPDGVRPKVHFSSPRTEMREIRRKASDADRAAAREGRTPPGAPLKEPLTPGSRMKTVLMPPVWTGHADYNNPFEFIAFMRAAEGLEFDVMLEAKAKDLSLLRLRADLPRYAPDVAARFGRG